MSREQAAVSRRRNATPEAIIRCDGIDVLQNELLQHVLSFLPVPEAVQTCVLARRWEHLWKSMPIVRVTGEGWTLNRRGVRKLNKFVNHLLLLRDRTHLHTFEVKLGTFQRQSKDEPQINLWIRHALLCHAQVLSVHVSSRNHGFDLEDMPLISRHLTRLELCNVSLNGSILNLSRCPALEELCLRDCYILAQAILSQSLKRLTILGCLFYQKARTRISIPSLVTLELTDFLGMTPFLESLPSLVTGTVKIALCFDCCLKEAGDLCFGGCEDCGANYDGSGDSVLLNGLSEAKSLELMAEPRVVIFRRDLMWCPTFSKLKTLLLNEWCLKSNLGALICLLQHTPVLEKLTIQLCQALIGPMGTEDSHNPISQPFASKKLKVLKIKCAKIDERVHKILTVLGTYGMHIEHISIHQGIGSSEGPMDFSRVQCYLAPTHKMIPGGP